jgi:hypothetical protein|tara:strand:- start:861 stop:1007 length:147 start_codon:yes stop_codon:yes gene_type:complete
MVEVTYKKIINTNSNPNSKTQKEWERRMKLAIALVMLQDKELLKLLAK